MGNCCGKPSSSGNFQGEGRTLGARPADIPQNNNPSQPGKASLPSNVNQSASAVNPARKQDDGSMSAAGRAAQERMSKASAATGKLGQQLAEQKKQTRTDTLKAASEEQRQVRDAQANAEAINWN